MGCCSFVWIHWMTQPMIRAYKHGLNTRDLFEMPNQDQVIVGAIPLWACLVSLREQSHEWSKALLLREQLNKKTDDPWFAPLPGQYLKRKGLFEKSRCFWVVFGWQGC